MLIDFMETEKSSKLHEVGARLRNAQTWIKDANGGCPGRSIWWHVEYGTTGLHAKGTTTRQQKPRDSCSCRSRATIVEKQAFGGAISWCHVIGTVVCQTTVMKTIDSGL
ncbi:hypothetical protein T05_6722 [Trichinella murrelli]|uniref:Uncharacterized protein n=1 Tax=Trichinella murrelli TaxID=144512 RepID=A0A0V0T4K1_9BILA|nr:hypothetical protein T05_7483 [Trichinella murrelli]KRX34004.1 hypothetical protein T05_6722 [Trichinella murrelli]